jgi:hypothetical protein
MIKKAKKGKAAGKKAGKKKGGAKSGVKRKKNELNPAEVRKEVSRIVEAHAGKLAQAVVTEGEKGQLGPVKFLFEMANIYPPTTDGSQASAREECLAETLLDRLGIPKTPVVADELAKEDLVVIPAGIMQNSDEEEDEGDLEPEEAVTPEKSGEDVGGR